MAFSNGKAGYSWLGVYRPPIAATAVYCDPCAHAGAVPFEDSRCGACGWKGQIGDARECPDCGAGYGDGLDPYAGSQLRPWVWEPAGWNAATDATPCGCCGSPAASGLPFWAREPVA